MTAPRAEEVALRLDRVRRRIEAAGADPERVVVVAVTKGFDADAVRVASDLGLDDVAESYAQELVAKAGELAGERRELRWHFVGRLQTNKVRHLAPIVACWQSVDRLALGESIARHSPGARVLVQVNVSGEVQKGGVEPADAGDLVAGLRALSLDVAGLMAVGRAGPPGAADAGFRLLTRLSVELGLPERSMGMSDDLEAAVAAGATMVRVGTALFGPRPPRPS